MTKLLWISIGLGAFLGFVGCAEQPGSSKDQGPLAKKEHDVHDVHDDNAPGPHGGTIFHYSKYHAEITVDHEAREATIYILSLKDFKPVAVTIDKPILNIKNPPFQAELKPVPMEGDGNGKSSRFLAKHDHFAKEQEFEGTLSGMMGGKPFVGDFKQKDHADHKHEKK
jgi:hypothetical protein